MTDPTGPASGLLRIMRGGNWELLAAECRSANRNGQSPGHAYFLGFRPALTPSPTK